MNLSTRISHRTRRAAVAAAVVVAAASSTLVAAPQPAAASSPPCTAVWPASGGLVWDNPKMWDGGSCMRESVPTDEAAIPPGMSVTVRYDQSIEKISGGGAISIQGGSLIVKSGTEDEPSTIGQIGVEQGTRFENRGYLKLTAGQNLIVRGADALIRNTGTIAITGGTGFVCGSCLNLYNGIVVSTDGTGILPVPNPRVINLGTIKVLGGHVALTAPMDNQGTIQIKGGDTVTGVKADLIEGLGTGGVWDVAADASLYFVTARNLASETVQGPGTAGVGTFFGSVGSITGVATSNFRPARFQLGGTLTLEAGKELAIANIELLRGTRTGPGTLIATRTLTLGGPEGSVALTGTGTTQLGRPNPAPGTPIATGRSTGGSSVRGGHSLVNYGELTLNAGTLALNGATFRNERLIKISEPGMPVAEETSGGRLGCCGGRFVNAPGAEVEVDLEADKLARLQVIVTNQGTLTVKGGILDTAWYTPEGDSAAVDLRELEGTGGLTSGIRQVDVAKGDLFGEKLGQDATANVYVPLNIGPEGEVTGGVTVNGRFSVAQGGTVHALANGDETKSVEVADAAALDGQAKVTLSGDLEDGDTIPLVTVTKPGATRTGTFDGLTVRNEDGSTPDGEFTIEYSATAAWVTVALPPKNTVPPATPTAALWKESVTATSPDLGTWTGTDPITYERQWQRCDVGATPETDCDDISGATGETYQLADADQGSTVRVSVKATNGIGDATAVSAISPMVTGTAPVSTASIVQGTSGRLGWYTSEQVVVRVDAVAGADGVAPDGIRYIVDGGPFEQVESDGSVDITLTGEGSHTIEYWSVAGNDQEDHKTLTLRIDSIAPTVDLAFSTAPAPGGWTNASSVTVSATCTDAGSGMDEPAFPPLPDRPQCPNPVDLGSGPDGPQQPPAGTFVARDVAGNVADLSLRAKLIFDRKVPVVGVTGVSQGASYQAGAVPTPGCVAEDDLASLGSLPGSPVSTLTPAGVAYDAPGPHTVSCAMTDRAGNAASANAAYTVTAAPPPPPPASGDLVQLDVRGAYSLSAQGAAPASGFTVGRASLVGRAQIGATSLGLGCILGRSNATCGVSVMSPSTGLILAVSATPVVRTTLPDGRIRYELVVRGRRFSFSGGRLTSTPFTVSIAVTDRT